MKKTQLFLILVLAFTRVFADEPLLKPTVQPYANLQFWTMHSEGLSVDGEAATNRAASYFRRGRLGLKGKLMENLTYNFMLSFDYLAKDSNMASKGKTNSGDVKVWSAYGAWNALPESQWLIVTAGTFLPHLSRESVTSPWSVSSLDKGESSCYLRQFVTGKTNGISPGINIGGLGVIGKSQLLYNVAYINRQDNVSIMTDKWSPVLLGHVILNVGHKEWSSYKYTLSGNALKKQKMLSIGVGASMQGETDVFQSSSTYGADVLVYLNGLKVDCEYYFLQRKNQDTYLARCMMARASYNIFLKNSWVLEPAFMLNQFNGDESFSDASFYDGKDRTLDTGINLISETNKLKLGLHFIHRTGNGTRNLRVTSSGTYGDYLNLGIQIMI